MKETKEMVISFVSNKDQNTRIVMQGERVMIQNFNFYHPVNLEFGKGTLSTIGTHAAKYGDKALIVTTGDFFEKNGLVGKILSLLNDAGVASELFSDVSPNPMTTEIDLGAEFAKRSGCNVMIGLGGGSAMDAAKGIAISAAHEGGLWKYCGIGEGNDGVVTEKTLPIIAITTTSGTGSHVTPWAVFTNPATNEKPGMGGPYLFPKVSIVDPELMMSLPPRLTAATGFDAFAHALEAYTSNLCSPFTDMYAVEAMKLVGRYIVSAVNDGDNIEARTGMALADTLAGIALGLAEVTLCHAMAHAVGGVCKVHHGEVLALMTPYTVEFSMRSLPEKFKIVGKLLKGESVLDISDTEAALAEMLNTILTMRKDIGLDKKLSDIGVKESDLPEIANNTLTITAGSVSNDARTADYDDIMALLKKAL